MTCIEFSSDFQGATKMCNSAPISPDYGAHAIVALISSGISAHYNNSGLFSSSGRGMGGWISGERQASVRTRRHKTGQTGSENVLTSLKS